jgi:carboxylate-amine ligase
MAPTSAAGVDPDALTVGVEEEFLLLDPDTGANQPVAEQVMASLPGRIRERGRLEVRRSVVGMVTGACGGLDDVRAQVTDLRRAAADAADDAGAWLVAVGATPIAELDPALPDQPRYRAIAHRFGPVALDPAVCGLHVRVGVPDRDLAVQVCNHLQVWLPVIRALTGNSPLFAGADTGHASWRAVQQLRWPGAGPNPRFGSADDYDRTVADLVTSGVLLDPSMVRWYARLSPDHPAVEIRVNDVCTDVDDSLLAVALIRAAVATAITDIQGGLDPPDLRECVVGAAHWRAARDGLTGTLIDLRLGRARPAWELINEFFATVSPALLHTGDLDLVVDGLARLRDRGDGATRQRDVFQRTNDVRAVLGHLALQSAA